MCLEGWTTRWNRCCERRLHEHMSRRSFPKARRPQEAFGGGCTSPLPPSLIKSKHEMDAHKRVPRWIAALRASGFDTVRILCPPRRCRETILNLEPWVKRNEEPGRSPDRDVVSQSELATVLPSKTPGGRLLPITY